MGMDWIEIIMDVEDHFGISISDSEAERICTVGDLLSLLRRRIAAAQQKHCPAMPAFLSLRRLIRATCHNESLRIRPRDSVTTVLNRQQRRELWTRLSDLLGAPPDPLRRPPLLRRLLVGASLGMMPVALGSAFVIDFRIWPLTMLMAAFAVGCLHYATLPFRWIPPDGWSTLGDITNKIVGVSAATQMIHLQTEEEILDELRPLLINVLGVDAGLIVPSARFVEDLGVD